MRQLRFCWYVLGGRTFCLAGLLLTLQLVTGTMQTLAQDRPSGPVLSMQIQGTIGVATELYFEEVLEKARAQNSNLVIVSLDTPGGLVTSTRKIIQAILASDVPVAVYVSPSGAHAASAGTYIAYAAHIAAMAPGTNIGAATPIQLGGMPGLPGTPEPSPGDRDKPAAPQPADAKSINDAVAFLKSLAQLRGRNAAWAEEAVRSAATLTAGDALREGVIDIVARDIGELLNMVDGRSVEAGGRTMVLDTKGKTAIAVQPGWRASILNLIADPNVAFILLLIGIYGIIFEFYSPGFIGPGVIGAISLILGLMALSLLPVQLAALLLVLAGVVFMIVEASTPGVGIVGAGGLVMFIAGAMFLFDPSEADIDFRVALPLVLSTAAMTAAALMAIVGFALRARRRVVASGAETLIGGTGSVTTWKGRSGIIRIQGELWKASGPEGLMKGQTVRVSARTGLVLDVTACS
jgi:membrane-bound serine protease (ClpP class)